MLTFPGERLRDVIDRDSSAEDVRSLRTYFGRRGTFDFPALDNGLFSAARLAGEALYTGYDNVWVRDNVYVAYAHQVGGQVDVAEHNVAALTLYFQRHRHRFETIIKGDADPSEPMNRPHVRFNGQNLSENPEKWSHAQNDALGYFLWLSCRLAIDRCEGPTAAQWDLFGLFPLLFRAIRYWEDEDSGHWEEVRKVAASSIGTVVAALREMCLLMESQGVAAFRCLGESVSLSLLDALIDSGRQALNQILPRECVQSDPAKQRNYDAALLFLIYPLQVVDDVQADRILRDVEVHLQGKHGVRRYLGDSFWCADYKSLQAPELRTSDVSDDMTARNSLLRVGEEAHWCIFDPVLSAIHGRRYLATGDTACFEKQVHHFNRSLSQLTDIDSGHPEYRCPELYYRESGRYVANDVTPLLWTQANLSIAFNYMERSKELSL
jgi:hypothetical protein